jgi:hypothetical protein
MNCGEEREIAAHGLCFKCYRREERSTENPWAAADKHNRSMLKAHGQLRKAVTAILNALDSAIAHFSEEDVTAIRNICGSYLAAMATGLITPKTEKPVNSEQPSTVNSSQEEAEGATVNGEHDQPVNCSPDPQPQSNDTPVNNEHQSDVNCSQPESNLEQILNSEQVSAVNCSPESPSPEEDKRITIKMTEGTLKAVQLAWTRISADAFANVQNEKGADYVDVEYYNAIDYDAEKSVLIIDTSKAGWVPMTLHLIDILDNKLCIGVCRLEITDKLKAAGWRYKWSRTYKSGQVVPADIVPCTAANAA